MSVSLIVDPARARIKATKMTGDHLLQVLETLASNAELAGEESSTVCVFYVQENDHLQAGKYVPELYLSVRRLTDEDIETNMKDPKYRRGDE